MTAQNTGYPMLSRLDMIRYLLNRRMFTQEFNIDDTDSILKELNKCSTDELLSKYNEESKKERLFLALVGDEKDKLRFFNQLDAKADYIHYCRLAVWTKEQAVALALGKNPKIVNWNALNNYLKNPPQDDPAPKSTFIENYERIREIIFADSNLKDSESPQIFIQWFMDSGIGVSDELLKTASDFKIKISNPADIIDSYPVVEELDPRCETTFLHIIGVLLQFIEGKTGVPAHSDYSNRTQLIEHLCNVYKNYRGISARTLNRILPEANEKIEKPD